MKIKIFFVIPNLHCGGAQRCFANLLNDINIDLFDTTLIIFDKKKSVFFGLIPDDIKIIHLNASRVRYGLFQLYRLIKEHDPKIIFSTLTQINVPLAFFKRFFFKRKIFIAREANLVSQNLNRYKFKFIWIFFYKFFYNEFDKIICISKLQYEDLVNNFNIIKKKINIIYNPISIDFNQMKGNKYYDSDELINKYFKNKNKTYFVAVGSLSIQKGFELLIDTFVNIRTDNFFLYIVGDGPLKKKLQSKIDRHSLNNKIKLIGYSNNPYFWLKNADFFVLTSLYEGLGTVMLESIVLRTPVLSFPVYGIAKEILEDIEGCHYIDEVSISKFSHLINSMIGKRYKIKSKYGERFKSIKIISQYENLFLETYNNQY